jgi:hypothetical protein
MPLPESSHAVDSPEYAALLDDLPLNPSTGLKSTRDKFELPKKREMGGEGEGLGKWLSGQGSTKWRGG